MAKVQITQSRSSIKRPKDQVATLKALGLGKIGKTIEVEANDAIRGMMNKVGHLISVKEL